MIDKNDLGIRLNLLQLDSPYRDSRLPAALSKSCRRNLARVGKGMQRNSFDLDFLSSLLILKKQRRTSACNFVCEQEKCTSCKIAKANGPAAKGIIFVHKSKQHRPRSKDDPSIHHLCGRCFLPLYRGCVQGCTYTSILNNILNYVPTNVQQRF